MTANKLSNLTAEKLLRVLVVDDEGPIRNLLRSFLEAKGYTVQVAAGGTAAVELFHNKTFDLVILDLLMPDMDGLSTLKEIKRIDEDTTVFIMTAFGTIDTAVDAMKSGADEFLIKPLALEALGILIERAREHRLLREECVALRARSDNSTVDRLIVTRNREMERILEVVAKMAPLPITVLIQGESGTGKELIAQAIHKLSARGGKRFMAINCGVLPVDLLESELFGYERGAFTGAETRKVGYFEAASGGTVFLDEISETSANLQVKLLRVIQERVFQRVGGTEEITADVRIIASTNKNLEEEIAQGRFRKDLYYRLNVVQIRVPPLRERPEDIPLLAYHFLEKYAEEFGKQVTGIDPAVIERLQQSEWEGNVRELENVLERAVAMADGPRIGLKELPLDLGAAQGPLADGQMELKPLQSAKGEFEANYLRRLLESTKGNIALAARVAGIPRQNLYEKLYRHGISRDTFRQR